MSSYLRMYWNDYVKENDLEYIYLNHTGKFISFMEELGYGDRIYDIGEEQIRQTVAEYSQKGSIKTVTTMNNHLNAIRNFYVYLQKKGKAENIFNKISDYDSFRKKLVIEHHLKETRTKGYFEDDQVLELLEYFNSSEKSKYANMGMMGLYFKINLLVPAKKKVIANLKISDFSETFNSVKINNINIRLPRALCNDINRELSKLDVKYEKDDLFFKQFFQGNVYAETVFNAPLFYALKETGYPVQHKSKASFPIEYIRNTGIVNLYNSGADLYVISKIAGISLTSLEKILKELSIQTQEDWEEKINRSICCVKYYTQV